MKININEFRVDATQPVEAPLDFATLQALLAEHQAATATARLARDGEMGGQSADRSSHPAIAAFLPGTEKAVAGLSAHGSFHAAAAAKFNAGS